MLLSFLLKIDVAFENECTINPIIENDKRNECAELVELVTRNDDDSIEFEFYRNRNAEKSLRKFSLKKNSFFSVRTNIFQSSATLDRMAQIRPDDRTLDDLFQKTMVRTKSRNKTNSFIVRFRFFRLRWIFRRTSWKCSKNFRLTKSGTSSVIE